MRKQRLKVFLDTSALIAGIASSKGAARAVLQLAAAIKAKVDFLTTWDKKHFIGKNIHIHSNMKIVTPVEFLKYFRECL